VRGRIGIYELVTVDDDLRRLIHDNAPEHALTASAFRASENLLQSAMRHVAAGLTTIEEALRVCRRAETGDGLV
jgi:general secretion pathway protein E